MNIFEEVENRANIIDICENLGIKLNRNYKALCPFHNEHTPSFSVSKNKQIFKCFGCGESGNAINLVSKILNLRPLEAAKYINDTFNLGIEIGRNSKVSKSYINTYKQKREAKIRFLEWENKTVQLLCDYYRLLQKYKREEEVGSDKWVHAVYEEGYISYLIDEVFINGTDEDKIYFKKNERKVVLNCEQELGRTNA